MGKICLVTGKHTVTGTNVSHSKRRTKRHLRANLQTRRLRNPATGRRQVVTISTRGLRTLKKWEKEGRIVDLSTLS
jgi:large subunit ribosomal protein L28